MRVAVNCRSFLKTNYTGIGRYAFNLVRELLRIDQANTYCLYARRRLFDRKRRLPDFKAVNAVVKADPFGLGPARLLRGVDIYHSPSLDNIPRLSARIVTTLHDLIFLSHPEVHTPQARALSQRFLDQMLSRSERIICCSRTTAAALKEYAPLDEARVKVVYQGVDKALFRPLQESEQAGAARVLQRLGIRSPYLLFVGTLEPRKNLAGVLKALHLLKERDKKRPVRLVAAGMKGWMTEELPDLVGHLGLSDDVTFLGYLPDQELRILYDRAQVFVFPSLAEGFGFPVLEAMSCGTAVVTSSGTACAEIAGDAAVTVDPRDEQAIADAVAAVLEDDRLRGRLQEKALKRAEDFSFEKTARQTLAVYEEMRP